EKLKLFMRKINRELVTVDAQAANDARGYRGEEGGVPEGYACMNIGDVHFDEWDGHCGQGVTQGDAGVRQAARIDDDGVHPAGLCAMDVVDQSAFVVALIAAKRGAGSRRLRLCCCFNVSER